MPTRDRFALQYDVRENVSFFIIYSTVSILCDLTLALVLFGISDIKKKEI